MDERTAWNRRYSDGEYVPRAKPAPFVEAWLDHIPPGRALDIACGTGRNALRLAEAGFDVDAVDISEVAVDRARTEAERRGLDIRWHVADMDEFDIPSASFQLITVIRYRNPALWERLVGALAPNGWILIEHHLKSSRDVVGPKTPDFRLDPGELVEAFRSLRIVSYHECLEPADLDRGHYALARLAACLGDPGF